MAYIRNETQIDGLPVPYRNKESFEARIAAIKKQIDEALLPFNTGELISGYIPPVNGVHLYRRTVNYSGAKQHGWTLSQSTSDIHSMYTEWDKVRKVDVYLVHSKWYDHTALHPNCYTLEVWKTYARKIDINVETCYIEDDIKPKLDDIKNIIRQMFI